MERMKMPQTDLSSDGLLSTADIGKLMELSRKALRYYDETGLCTPAYVDESNGYHYYSTAQIYNLALIKASSDMGVPINALNDYLGTDDHIDFDRLLDRAYLETMEQLRCTRRAIKSIVRCQQIITETEQLGIRNEPYLRYLPERWCAFLPLEDHMNEQSSIRFARNNVCLKHAIETYGWAGTLQNGTLFSLSQNTHGGSACQFVELSSPPMPEYTGGMIIDGGCYRSAGSNDGCPGCTASTCQGCARVGRTKPDLSERAEQGAASTAAPSLFTLMMDDMEEPYLTGSWAEFTLRKIAERRGQVFDGEKQRELDMQRGRTMFPETAERWSKHKQDTHISHPTHNGYRGTPARRPMRMPMTTFLPNGISAGVLPAGIYLCQQHDVRQQASDLANLFSRLISRLPLHELTRDEEYVLHLSDLFRTFHAPRPRSGPAAEPFSEPRVVADQERAGWFEALGDDLSGIELVTGTGLTSDTDFCIVDAHMMFPEQDVVPRKEFEMLVYAEALPEL
jgi:DNA-binding transcriptional MerR regulator